MRRTSRSALVATFVTTAVVTHAWAQEARRLGSRDEASVEVLWGPDAESDARASVSPELRAYREHRLRLERIQAQGATDVGGSALLGLRVGDKSLVQDSQVDPRVREILQDWDGHGAAVQHVAPGSPADHAGVMEGDVIVRFAGLWVDNHVTLIRLATRAEPGQEYEMQYLRDGNLVSTWAIPRNRSDIDLTSMPRDRSGRGIAAEPLTMDAPGLRAPRLVEGPAPPYPPAARDAGIEGDVVLSAVVDSAGRVGAIEIEHSSGHADFKAAAVDAVSAFEWSPGHREGRDVAVRVPIRIRFLLK